MIPDDLLHDARAKRILQEEISKLTLNHYSVIFRRNCWKCNVQKYAVLKRYEQSRCTAVVEWPANEILSAGQ